MRLYKRLGLLLVIFLLLAACGRAAPPMSPATSATPQELQSQVDSLKSQLQDAQDKLASYKLRAQNWDYWQKVDDFLYKTMEGVSRTRGLPAPDNVEMMVVTVDWAKQKWGDDYVRDNSRKIQIDERVFKGLFLLPESTSLADLYASWPRSYLATALGDKVYFVQANIGSLSGDDLRKVLAHEVVHLLQYRFQTPELPTYDADKAWSALVEGDADFTRATYLAQIAGEKPPEFGKLPPASLTTNPEPERPPGLTSLLYFPYQYGQPFLSALYQNGGWAGVNEAFAKPPVSTRQIMHPERYLANEGPRDIKPLPLTIPGGQEAKVDRLGEYFIRVMFQTWLPEAEATAAAQGWVGDRLVYYERPPDCLLTWQTAWDSDSDATQFYQAFLKMLGKVGATQAGELWSARGEYLSVRQTGDQVLVIASRVSNLVSTAASAAR